MSMAPLHFSSPLVVLNMNMFILNGTSERLTVCPKVIPLENFVTRIQSLCLESFLKSFIVFKTIIIDGAVLSEVSPCYWKKE